MIEVKQALSPDDFDILYQIRSKVFVEEQKVDAEEEFDEFENISRHFLAFYNQMPVGTSRWRETEYGIKLERFAVLEPFRKFGVGRALVLNALHDVFNSSTTNASCLIYLHAQVHVIPFYEKLGFEAFGEEFSEANIRHRKMKFIQKSV